MLCNLVIGYGNLERQDDGVGFYVVNRLRRHLGQKPLARDDDGLSRLGRRTDSIFTRQLVPELIETVVQYDRVIFVDAHEPPDMPHIVCTRIYPDVAATLFSHHMHPQMLLGFLKALYDREPVSHLVSIQGSRFEFERGLSVKTAALVAPVTEMILAMLEMPPVPRCLRPADNQRSPTPVG
jgi:hydrogenase maturation protease